MRTRQRTARGAALGIPATILLMATGFWLAGSATGAAKPAAAAGGGGGGADRGGSLKDAAGKRLLIGVAVMSGQLEDPKLAAHITEQFNCLTPENEFKPENLQPRKGEFNFGP